MMLNIATLINVGFIAGLLYETALVFINLQQENSNHDHPSVHLCGRREIQNFQGGMLHEHTNAFILTNVCAKIHTDEAI